MKIWVMDEEVTSDETIGEATVKLSALCVNGGIDDWWTITYKGKKAGRLHMIGNWTPSASNPMAAAAARKPGVLSTAVQQTNVVPTYLTAYPTTQMVYTPVYQQP